MGDEVRGRAAAARAVALLPLVGMGLLLGGCRDQRNEAVSELARLNEVMQRHATQYGRFPETIDPDRPAAPDNLPYGQERKVSVRLIGGNSESYAATARSGVWLCGVKVGLGQRAMPDCVPTGSGPSADAEDVRPPSHLDQILEDPGAPGDSVGES